MAKKQKIAQPRAALEAKVKKLQAENRSLRKRVKELEEKLRVADLKIDGAINGLQVVREKPIGDLVRVEVGPLDDASQLRMPWDDALPNGFAEGK